MHQAHRRTRVVLLALACAALLPVASCSAAKSSAAPAPLKVGLLAALSGTYAAVGKDLRDGFQLYLDTHNGKLGGHPVDLVVGDEGDGPATAVPAATKMVKDDRVLALTGVVGGGSVAAATSDVSLALFVIAALAVLLAVFIATSAREPAR